MRPNTNPPHAYTRHSLRNAEAVRALQVASDQVARSLKVSQGALVQSVPAGSPAAQAGLQGTRRTITGIAAGTCSRAWQPSLAEGLCAASATHNRHSGTKPEGLLHVSRAAATAACTVAVHEVLVGWSCSFTALLGTLMLRRACTPRRSCILQLVDASGARSISPLCGMAGDVVVGLNGRPITKGSDLIGAMDTLEDGQTVRTWPCRTACQCRKPVQLLHD